jgi:hypothetical protein
MNRRQSMLYRLKQAPRGAGAREPAFTSSRERKKG